MKIRKYINIILKIILTPILCIYCFSLALDLDFLEALPVLFISVFLSTLFIFLLYTLIDLIFFYYPPANVQNKEIAYNEKNLINEQREYQKWLVAEIEDLKNSLRTVQCNNAYLKDENRGLLKQTVKQNYYPATMTLIERSPHSKRTSPKLNEELTYDAYIITATYKIPVEGQNDVYETIIENRICYAYFRNKRKQHRSSGFLRFLQKDVDEGIPVVVMNIVNFNKQTEVITNEGDKYLIKIRSIKPCPQCDINNTERSTKCHR